MPRYNIAEPHPRPPMTNIIHVGRGGAGNYRRVNRDSILVAQMDPPASRVPIARSGKIYSSGRGGAGNVHHSERAMFSFDEELETRRQSEDNVAPIYYMGIGGAGNRRKPGEPFFAPRRSTDTLRSTDTRRTDSLRSTSPLSRLTGNGSTESFWQRFTKK